jgi:hypothetical protein
MTDYCHRHRYSEWIASGQASDVFMEEPSRIFRSKTHPNVNTEMPIVMAELQRLFSALKYLLVIHSSHSPPFVYLS